MSKSAHKPTTEPEAGKENLRDYNSVAGLKAGQLKKLCKTYNIDPKFPKKARIVLLCHILGISTTGHVQSVNSRSDVSKHLSESQKQELNGITPAYMCQLNDWKKDISGLPDIEESAVKKYLINADVLKASDARTYKISRPFALQQFVHSIVYNDNGCSEVFSLVRAQCNPSQSTNADDVKVVFVIIDKYLGEPYGGFCTCTVGNCERCGHIGAVLFKIAQLQATGASEGPSCTDVLCKWADPKGCKAEPTVFQDLNIRKAGAPIRRTVDDYGQKVANQAPPSYDEVVELRASLLAATHHLGQYCPAIHVLNCDRFKPPNAEKTPVNIVFELPNRLQFESDTIAPAKEVEVKTTPAVLSQLVTKYFGSITDSGYKEASEELYKKAADMNIDFHEVNNITRGQSNNPEWHEQRRGVITATKFATVIKIIEKKKSGDSVIKEMFDTKNDKLKNVPAIRWGRKYETKARQTYVNKFVKHHKDFKIEDQGLIVYKNCNFIRGSPDGIVSCKCHGRILVEIKCPYSARMMTVTEGVTQGKIKYLESVNGRFTLKENSADGYYAQVQGLMGITNIKICNFIVWTTRDMLTVNVHYNEEFFINKLVPACKEFFRVFSVPRLLLRETEDIHVEPPAAASECNETPVPSSCDAETSAPDGETSAPEMYTATPLAAGLISADEDQPSKRKRVTLSRKTAVKTASSSKASTSHQLFIPTASTSTSETTSAQKILAETTTYKCASCRKDLPDDNIASDNSDASVGCDCPNCGGCDIWMCWKCAKYDQEWADQGYNWYCPECTRECDLIY